MSDYDSKPMKSTRIFPMVRAMSFSAMGLGVMSASNFALSVMLIKILPLKEFGIYGIGYAAVLFYTSIGQAMFLSQMVANAPDKAAEDKEPFAATILVGVLGFSCATIFFVSAIASVAVLLSGESLKLVAIIFAFCAFGIAHQIKDYFVTYSFLFRRESVVLGINIVVAVALFLQLGVYLFAGKTVTVGMVATTYAISLGAGSAVGFLVFRIKVSGVTYERLRRDVAESWGNGKWALLGVAVSWLQSQAYVTISAIMLGPVSVGLANAARLFVVPFSLVATSVGQVVVPRLSDLRVADRSRVPVMGRLFVGALTGFALIYIAIIYLSMDFLSGLLFKQDYLAAVPLVGIWCVTLLVGPLRTGGVVVLQAFKGFRGITTDYALSAALTVGLAVILIKTIGVSGAIVSLVLGDGFVGWLLWRRVRRSAKSPRIDLTSTD